MPYVYYRRLCEDPFIDILTSSGVLAAAERDLRRWIQDFPGWKPGPCSNATELFTKLAAANLEWWRLIDSSVFKQLDIEIQKPLLKAVAHLRASE
jgi:hypothetical protein